MAKEVKITKLREGAQIPTRGSDSAAGYDLRALYPVDKNTSGAADIIEIGPHRTVAIGTGLAVAIPEGYFGGIYARSGLSIKQGLRPGNCTGVIDSDYRGELIVGLHNDSYETKHVKVGDRIAQLIIQPYEAVEFKEVDTLDETERGEGGFGSTGSN